MPARNRILARYRGICVSLAGRVLRLSPAFLWRSAKLAAAGLFMGGSKLPENAYSDGLCGA